MGADCIGDSDNAKSPDSAACASDRFRTNKLQLRGGLCPGRQAGLITCGVGGPVVLVGLWLCLAGNAKDRG